MISDDDIEWRRAEGGGYPCYLIGVLGDKNRRVCVVGQKLL